MFFIIPTKNRCFYVVPVSIVPESHCFTYPNGALRDNPKSNACKILKVMVDTEAPQNSNTVNVDDLFLIQSTLGYLSYSIFVQKDVLSVLSDLCFNVYESLSNTQKDKKRKKEEMKNLIVFLHWSKNKNGNRHV